MVSYTNPMKLLKIQFLKKVNLSNLIVIRLKPMIFHLKKVTFLFGQTANSVLFSVSHLWLLNALTKYVMTNILHIA